MIKLTSFNKNFFKKHKKTTLVATCILGTLVATIPLDIHLPDFRKELCYDFEEKAPAYIDRYIWSDYTSDECDINILTYNPADSYKMRIFRGSSNSDYYRILVRADTERYSEWKKIPDDDLIIVNHDEYDTQYGNKFDICFGSYNIETGEIEENSRTFVFGADYTKEQVEKFNQIREKAVADVKKIVKFDDSDFVKVKKAYDYVISNFAYLFDWHFNRSFIDDIYKDILGRWYIDCTGYADILNTIFENIGIESITTVDDTHGHVWNIVKVDDCYYHLDATYSDTGSFENTSKYRFFLVSDEFMLQDNRWFTSEKDVVCPNTYDLTGLVNENDSEFRGLK